MRNDVKHHSTLKGMNTEDKFGRAYKVGKSVANPGCTQPTIDPRTVEFGQKLAKSSNGMLGK